MIPRASIALLILLLASHGYSQDTPTEKEAAREVLKKMAALEQSLDVPGIVTRLTGPNAERDRVVARAKELMDQELLALSDDIATHPEIGFEEKRSNHTYEMDADNLKPIGHNGFTVDAQTMAALLFDFATRPDYRAAVKKEFDGIKQLFGEYIEALKKVYTVPTVPEPKE
jgi:hypothetical protein